MWNPLIGSRILCTTALSLVVPDWWRKIGQVGGSPSWEREPEETEKLELAALEEVELYQGLILERLPCLGPL